MSTGIYNLQTALRQVGANQIVIAEDIAASGAKCFHVDTLSNFAKKYSLKKMKKHWYEILLENKPSRLYFDIESTKTVVDIQALIQSLYQNTVIFLKANGSDIVPTFEVLDSSSPSKSSFHVICTNVYLQNVYHVGAFVRRWVCQLSWENETYNANTDLDVIDTAVYTKNRMFRVKGSTKFGSTRVLKHRLPWSSLLVQLPPTTNNIFKCAEVDGSRAFATSSPPRDLFEYDADNGVWITKKTHFDSISDNCSTHCPLLTPLFDWMDDHLQAKLQRYTQSLTNDGIIMIYSHSKKCQVVEKGTDFEHRGNHIFFLIDLNQRMVFQHCHDAECKNRRCATDSSRQHFRIGKVQVQIPSHCWVKWNQEWLQKVPHITE
jgi:hypothetical protein|tara:strand:- start:2159 stop:3286 length:1128 start_codon:yes stop_codon:yes gene_type:complete